MELQINKKVYLFILMFSVVLFPHSVFASSIYIDANHSDFFVGDSILFSVRVDSDNRAINAVEGEVLLDHAADLASLTDINTASSKFSLWPSKPLPSERNTSIYFAGGVPGGITSKDAILFNFVLKLQEPGQITLSPNNIGVYLNDGKGTKDKVAVKDLTINVLTSVADIKAIDDWSKVIAGDKTPPESFEISIGKDPSLFDNKYFASFFTTDTESGSGIAYYEIQEGSGDFVRAESPHLLKDQSLLKLIKVKAIDKAGNERIEEFLPPAPTIQTALFNKYIPFGIVIVIIIIVFYLLFRYVKQKTKK